MKFFLLLILLASGFLSAQEIEIKTLQIYAGNNETALPVISDDERFRFITIEFDVVSEFMPDLNIIFRFCDRNWVPYDNLFLRNTGQDVAYNMDVAKLSVSVEDADYHFKRSFPNNYDAVSFPFSGKWIFHITDSNDTTKIYATGKFLVVHKELKLQSTLKQEKLEDETFFPADLAKVFNISTSFTLSDELYPSFVSHIEIIENQKLFYPVIVDRRFNTNRRQYYWDADREYSFTARDVRPGNEYRKTDLRDSKIYAGKDVRAQFDGIEYSRFWESPPRDMNGGFMISKLEIFPTYLNVLFEINPGEDFTGNIFLTGAFNEWQVLPQYQMENTGGIYRKVVTLKRGVYDYQYVTADYINGKIINEDWYLLEGNNWITTNVYHILLYYTDPQYGGYDRVIGYDVLLNR